MVVIVCRVGVGVRQERRVDIQDRVQVKAADVEQVFYVGFAEMHRCDGRARVHVHNT